MMTGWTELSVADAGRIIAALEHFAEDHPEAEILIELADKIANRTVLIEDNPTE